MASMNNLIDRVKDCAKAVGKVGVYAAVGAVAVLAGANKVDGEVVNDFRDLIDTSGSIQYNQMEIDWNAGVADNLIVRDSNGVDSVVEKDGSVWRIGFIKYGGDYMFIGGFANNDNPYSNNYPGFEGWCQGRFYDSVFANGEAVDDVMIVHDVNGDGLGDLTGGTWTLGSDDVVYWSEDIEFNGNQGDVSQMPIPNYMGGITLYLPHMVISFLTARHPNPEDLAKDVDLNVELSWTGKYGAVHNVYFGTDPNNLENVSLEQSESEFYIEGLKWADAYYWRVDEVDSEDVVYPGDIWSFETIDDCSSSIAGDVNGDCLIDFKDFALMAENWLKCNRMGTGACP